MKAGGNFTNPGGGSSSTPAPAAHSRVNDFLEQHQFAPSIAGRHLKPRFGAVHLFVDSQQRQLSYRYSDQQAGQTGSGLRPAGAAAPALLQAHPNPTEGATRIQLQLQPGERVQSVTVTDLASRPVADLTPKRQTTDAKAASTQTLTWNAGAVPTGTYLIRAVTTKRTENFSITRQ